MRLEHWPRRSSERSHILFVTGRADFVEKYAETLHDLVDAAWGVTIFDWRGRGLSRRVGKTPMHGASPGFDIWLDDLAELVSTLTTLDKMVADAMLFAHVGGDK